MREVVEELGTKTGLVILKREVFEDPVMYSYFYNGQRVFSQSFLYKPKWWEGILTEEEVDLNFGKNLFRVAADKIGFEKLMEHLKDYSKKVEETVKKEISVNGWKVKAEFVEYDEEYIESMFGISAKRLPDELVKLRNAGIMYHEITEPPVKKPNPLILVCPYNIEIYVYSKSENRYCKAIIHDPEKMERLLESWEFVEDLDLSFVKNLSIEQPYLIYPINARDGIIARYRKGKLLDYEIITLKEIVFYIKQYVQTFSELMGRALEKLPVYLPKNAKMDIIKKFFLEHPEPEEFKRAILIEYGVEI
ncbi:MAG: hypothetical protein ABIL67_03735 [candidate division WOR-3 bacterium]